MTTMLSSWLIQTKNHVYTVGEINEVMSLKMALVVKDKKAIFLKVRDRRNTLTFRPKQGSNTNRTATSWLSI